MFVDGDCGMRSGQYYNLMYSRRSTQNSIWVVFGGIRAVGVVRRGFRECQQLQPDAAEATRNEQEMEAG